MDAQSQGLRLAPGWRHHHLWPGDETASLVGGSAIDPEIGEENDGDGEVEGDDGWEDEVPGILCKETGGRGWWRDRHAAPPGDSREADSSRTRPDESDEGDGPGGGHLPRIGDGIRDGPVAVKGDDGEIEDGGGACEDVEGVPDVTPFAAKHPNVVRYLERDAERHDYQTDDEVGDCQRQNEVVGDCAQLALAAHGSDDQHVA